MPGPTAIGELISPLRRRLVAHLVEKVERLELDPAEALIMLDVAGLTGDREALADAVAATTLIATTAAGSYMATGDYQPALDKAIDALATPRLLVAVPA